MHTSALTAAVASLETHLRKADGGGFVTLTVWRHQFEVNIHGHTCNMNFTADTPEAALHEARAYIINRFPTVERVNEILGVAS